MWRWWLSVTVVRLNLGLCKVLPLSWMLLREMGERKVREGTDKCREGGAGTVPTPTSHQEVLPCHFVDGQPKALALQM